MISWRSVANRVFGPPVSPLRLTSNPKPIDAMIGEMLASGNLYGGYSRAEALSVPAILRGRNEICSIATLPLQMRRDIDVVPSPLLRQIDPDVPNEVVLSSIIEDLLFEGIAWWKVTARDFDGFPVACRYIQAGAVQIDSGQTGAPSPVPAGHDPHRAKIWVDGVNTSPRDLIRFDSLNPGILHAARRPIQRAVLLDRLAAMYADNPRPLDYFTASDRMDIAPMADAEIPAFLAEWRAARKASSTAWIPESVTRVDVDAPSPADLQLVGLQQQVALELANALGLDPEDLGVSTTSRTYFNAQDRRQSKINTTYAPFMAAITGRLSMGDVTRRGYHVRFDLSDYLKPDPLTQSAYWKGLFDMGAISSEEVRSAAGWSGRPPAPNRIPAAAADPPAKRAAAGPGLTFGADGRLTFDLPIRQSFSVDSQRRTITGMALPYGHTASKFGVTYQFAPGSLEWSDVSRVKHLIDHSAPVGRALSISDGRDGLTVTLSVADGIEGSPQRLQRDQLLSDAAAGVYDGFSVGVTFGDQDIEVQEDGSVRILRATLDEVSTTALPAFDAARVTSVTATKGDHMCVHCGQPHAAGVACVTFARQSPAPTPTDQDPAPVPVDPQPVSDSDLEAIISRLQASRDAPASPAVVDPTRVALAMVREPDPYRIGFTGDLRTGHQIVMPGSHDFSSDIIAGFRDSDQAAYQRALAFVREQFNVATTDVNETNPTRQRPDMYVAQRQYRYPIWSAVNKGTLADITPFQFPKFSSATGLVGDHTEGTEPTTGTFVTTGQTVTPKAMSGLATINREVWDQGGNPQVSTLIWNQIVQSWYESLEAYVVTVLAAGSYTDLATFTAGGGTDYQTLSDEMETALAMLQFARGGYTFDGVFAQADLYKHLISAKDDGGRKLYPIMGATNANGQVSGRFGTIDVAGTTFYPAWALAAAGQTAATPSYLLDTSVVHGWASAPQRLTMDTLAVATVKIGAWGYAAGAVSDTSGVRDINYDPVA